jgi:hypothetical protein
MVELIRESGGRILHCLLNRAKVLPKQPDIEYDFLKGWAHSWIAVPTDPKELLQCGGVEP